MPKRKKVKPGETYWYTPREVPFGEDPDEHMRLDGVQMTVIERLPKVADDDDVRFVKVQCVLFVYESELSSEYVGPY